MSSEEASKWMMDQFDRFESMQDKIEPFMDLYYDSTIKIGFE